MIIELDWKKLKSKERFFDFLKNVNGNKTFENLYCTVL